MLNRLLAVLPSGRSYLDIGSDQSPTQASYWQAMAELNATVLHREGVPHKAIMASLPILSDLGQALAKARRAGA